MSAGDKGKRMMCSLLQQSFFSVSFSPASIPSSTNILCKRWPFENLLLMLPATHCRFNCPAKSIKAIWNQLKPMVSNPNCTNFAEIECTHNLGHALHRKMSPLPTLVLCLFEHIAYCILFIRFLSKCGVLTICVWWFINFVQVSVCDLFVNVCMCVGVHVRACVRVLGMYFCNKQMPMCGPFVFVTQVRALREARVKPLPRPPPPSSVSTHPVETLFEILKYLHYFSTIFSLHPSTWNILLEH